MRHKVSRFFSLALVAVGLFASCSSDETKPPRDPEPEPQPEPEPEPQGVVSLEDAPPPITGGTLLVTRDDALVVAADPDRDTVSIVDARNRAVLGTIAFDPGDEPARVLEDYAGRVHVVLRNAGEIATIDVAARSILRRVRACAAPRSITEDPSSSVLHVACAGGELVTMDADSGDVTSRVLLERDLRDVLVHDGRLLVTSFRSAELLVVEGGEVVRRLTPPSADVVEKTFIPHVAWRLLRTEDGVALLHQRAQSTPVQLGPNAYQDGVCSGAVVHGTVTMFDEDALAGTKAPPVPTYVPDAVQPVDAAISPDAKTFAVVSPGNSVVVRMPAALFVSGQPCGWAGLELQTRDGHVTDVGQPTAVAYDSTGRLFVQSREPATISIVSRNANTPDGGVIELSDVSRRDTGHDLFHTAPAGAIISCASCHAEGGDDGHTWEFIPDGIRRTQNLRGGISGRAPFHWSGDLGDFDELVEDTFVRRMGGVELSQEELAAFQRWIDRIPLVPFEVTDPEAVARGQAAFVAARCNSCHSGEMATNNKYEDVGTGGVFKVPTLLGLPHRSPFMRTGCAKTLHDRFDPECGGSTHGTTSELTPEDVDDVIAYMESLSATPQ